MSIETQTPPDTKLATTAPKLQVKDWLQTDLLKTQIAEAMPNRGQIKRFMRVLYTCVQKVPDLLLCTQASLYDCMIKCASLGFDPDGRNAHLIPFRHNQSGTMICTLIIDYKGYAKLAYDSGLIASLHADVVCSGDLFQYSKGVLKEHVPWFCRVDAAKPEKEGDIFAIYANAVFKDGCEKCEVMSVDEVEKIRQRSKSPNKGPWVTDLNEMRKKTAFRRLSKWIPLSPKIVEALDSDDDVIDLDSPIDTAAAAQPKQIEQRRQRGLPPSGLAAGVSAAPVVKESLTTETPPDPSTAVIDGELETPKETATPLAKPVFDTLGQTWKGIAAFMDSDTRKGKGKQAWTKDDHTLLEAAGGYDGWVYIAVGEKCPDIGTRYKVEFLAIEYGTEILPRLTSFTPVE